MWDILWFAYNQELLMRSMHRSCPITPLWYFNTSTSEHNYFLYQRCRSDSRERPRARPACHTHSAPLSIEILNCCFSPALLPSCPGATHSTKDTKAREGRNTPIHRCLLSVVHAVDDSYTGENGKIALTQTRQFGWILSCDWDTACSNFLFDVL